MAVPGLAKISLFENNLVEEKHPEDINEKRRNSADVEILATVTRSVHNNCDTYYCEKDLKVQLDTVFSLFLSYFYYPDISSSDAKQLLKHCAVGTFIVRDSSDHRYLYTVSVKTKRGPTSIRIVYEHGKFYFDADENSRHQMPRFSTLFDLLDHYIRISMGKKSDRCRFLDKSGRKDLPITLLHPKVNDVSSLKHLSRTLINRSLPASSSSEISLAIDKLPLPKPLRGYLKEYPYLF